MGFWIMKKKH